MTKTASLSIAMMLALFGSANASVMISSARTRNMNCSAGVCSPTAANAMLNTADLAAMLASSDVKVTTGAGAVTIGVTSPLSWGSSHRLTLDAQQSVSIRSTVIVEGTGGLTVTLDSGATGSLNFYPGGSISFWDTASSLIVQANAYTLVSDVATLASAVTASPSGFYALAKDYDASADGTFSDAPVKTPLAGTFEGLGHTISNLTVAGGGTAGDAIGFFAQVSGTARDLSLANASLDCGAKPIDSGLLAGKNSGHVMMVSVAGSIVCTRGDVGGLVGDNTGIVGHASANVTVTGGTASGGLVGGNDRTILDSSASGTVNAQASSVAGGLVGLNGKGLIEDSHAAVTVNGSTALDVGGLVGYMKGTIERCSSSGLVHANSLGGGLVGLAINATIDSAFATGDVSAQHTIGGLLGSGDTVTITNSYATSAVNQAVGGVVNLGGLIGTYDSVTIATSWSKGSVANAAHERRGGFVGMIGHTMATSAYWDLDTSGVSNPSQGAGNIANYSGIAGLTDTQLKSALPGGFDPGIWGQNASINNGYPYLLANPPQ